MENLYIYGITRKGNKLNLGPIGLFGKEIKTIDSQELAAITSSYDQEIGMSKGSLLTHMKVLDTILAQGFDVLPFKFGTVAQNETEVKNLLKDGYNHWLNLLDRVKGHVELTLQIFWKDFDKKVQQLVDEDKSIRDLRDRMLGQQSYRMLITTGEIFKNILEDKKRAESKGVLEKLMQLSKNYKENPFINDANIANWSFLVERGREKEFDIALNEIVKDKNDEYLVKYYGPSAPFNFV